MGQVTVVTDTTHYAPREVLRSAGIDEVSLYVTQDGVQRREADLGDLDAFYAGLRDAATLPTTSQPSIGDALAVLEPHAAAGRDVVCVHISGGISGTVESVRQAAAEIEATHPGRRVEVVDTRSACGGIAFCALAGAAAAAGGGDVDAVAARVRETAGALRMWFAVDTLEFLRRGGRIGTAQAWLGGALKIKPILTVDGEITPIERVRTSGRAFERLVAFLEERRADGADAWAVQHIQAPEDAARLVERGTALFGHPPVFVGEVGAVIGTHVGPGLLGVGGVPSRLLAPY